MSFYKPPPPPYPTNASGLPKLPPGLVWHSTRHPGIDTTWQDPSTGLTLLEQKSVFSAVKTPEETMQLVQEIFDQFPNRGLDIMEAAAEKELIGVVRWLYERDIDPKSLDYDKGIAVLHAAAFGGSLDCARFFIEECKMDVNVRNDKNDTPLISAACSWESRLEMVRWLLKNGADVLAENDNGAGALECAIGSGNMDIVKILLGAVRERDGEGKECLGQTAIVAAATSKKIEILDLVLKEAGFPMADEGGRWIGDLVTEAQREYIWAAIHATRQNADILHRLLSYLTLTNEKGEASFIEIKEMTERWLVVNTAIETAMNDDAELVDLFLRTMIVKPQGPPLHLQVVDTGRDVNPVDTIFFFAAANNSLRTAKLLLEKYHANVNHSEPSLNGDRAIFRAAAKNHLELLRYLLDRRDMDINAGSMYNSTALWIAVRNLKVEAVRMLLEYGGPVEEMRGKKPRHYPAKVTLTADKYPFAKITLWWEYLEEKKELESTDTRFMELVLTEEDQVWFERLQSRK